MKKYASSFVQALVLVLACFVGFVLASGGAGGPGSLSVTLGIGNGSGANNINMASGQVVQWNADSGISRLAAASFALGNGTNGDTTGLLRAQAVGVNTAAGVAGSLTVATSILGSPASTLGATTVTTLGTGGLVTLADGNNVAVGSTTGTQIATATTQKLGFFGTTPAAQIAGSTDVLAGLVTLGFRAASANPPLNLGTGAITAGACTLAATTVTTLGTGGLVTFADGNNISVGSTTGTQIATATTQKLGFFGTTAVAQQGGAVDVLASLVNLGLRAASANPPLNLGTGALTAGTTSLGATTPTSILGSPASTLGATTVTTLGTGGLVTLADGNNIAVGSTTGTQIATATTQKLGFFGTTPTAQISGSTDVLAGEVTLGFRAASSNPPLNLGTGSVTCGGVGLNGTAPVAATLNGPGNTVTASTPVLNLTQTFNSGAVTFDFATWALTDTASAAASRFLNLTKGGTAQVQIDKAGKISANSCAFGTIGGGGLLSVDVNGNVTGTGAPTMSGMGTITASAAQFTSSVGSITKYANVTTTGWGVPAIYGTGRSTAQTAAVASVAAYTVGASDGSFIVSANVLVTTSTTHNFTVTCAYTDEGNTARTLTFNFSNVGGTIATAIANAGGAVPYEGIPMHIRCKASTSITIATTGTFTTVTYNVEGMIAQIS